MHLLIRILFSATCSTPRTGFPRTLKSNWLQQFQSSLFFPTILLPFIFPTRRSESSSFTRGSVATPPVNKEAHTLNLLLHVCH